ncbi:SDR family NAD(P)-dependent oxidoreductase [Pseudonocardia sp.]|uniref:SDR family NAD(P)-dependent oxidoreductase n=1 Tax=Pseudonocardia sp. TaxID=60912 RepID=UPI003D0C18F5
MTRAGTAVVTGGSRGIGLAVVRALAASGMTVVLGARDPATVPGGLGEAVLVRRLDVTSRGDAAAVADELRARGSGLDVLVNNAAVGYDTWQDAARADLDAVEEILRTNLVGAWRAAVALLPLMGRGARIVNVSSGAGSFGEGGGAGAPAYSVSKAGLNMLTVRLAAAVRPRGVLVNAVCPGWVATDMGGPGGRPVAEGAASVLHAVDLPPGGPTGRFFRDGREIPW